MAPASVNPHHKEYPREGMSAGFSGNDVAAQLNHPVRCTYRDVRTTERDFELVRNLVEMAAFDGSLGSLGIADGFVDTAGGIALGGQYVELCQPSMADDPRRFDEFLGPPDGLVLFDPNTEEPRIAGDC